MVRRLARPQSGTRFPFVVQIGPPSPNLVVVVDWRRPDFRFSILEDEAAVKPAQEITPAMEKEFGKIINQKVVCHHCFNDISKRVAHTKNRSMKFSSSAAWQPH